MAALTLTPAFLSSRQRRSGRETLMLAASALEFPVYALCGSGSRDIVYPDVRDLRYGTLGQFTIVRCSRCKLSYLYPRPTKEHLAEYYPTHYWPLTSSTDTPERSSKVRTMLYRVLYNSLTCLYRVRFGNATP